MKVVALGKRYIVYSSIFIFLFSSCSTNKQIPYFQDIPDSIKTGIIISANYSEPVIQNDDIINIVIQTIDPQNTAVVNQVSSTPSVGASSASSIGNQQVTGYIVDKDGNVEIPLLGKIKIGGLTTSKAKDIIRERAALYYKEPSIQVRFANFKITVIGEVAKPATYTLPNEKVSILDAIGLAGDLTIYGRRENVLLIREIEQKKMYARLNLNSSQIFNSPYYYLRQNDVIYVEPNKAKITTTDAAKTRNITIGVSVLTAIIILLTRIIK